MIDSQGHGERQSRSRCKTVKVTVVNGTGTLQDDDRRVFTKMHKVWRNDMEYHFCEDAYGRDGSMYAILLENLGKIACNLKQEGI